MTVERAARRAPAVGRDQQVDVFGEALSEVPSLREAGATLEHNASGERRSDRAKGLRDPVVLFDESRASACGLADGREEVREVIALV